MYSKTVKLVGGGTYHGDFTLTLMNLVMTGGQTSYRKQR